MSKDKRKKIHRAYELLREINCGRYVAPNLTGRKHSGRWRFSLKHPTIKYIIKRGLAKLVRTPAHRGHKVTTRNTKLDTGVPWAREWRREDQPRS